MAQSDKHRILGISKVRPCLANSNDFILKWYKYCSISEEHFIHNIISGKIVSVCLFNSIFQDIISKLMINSYYHVWRGEANLGFLLRFPHRLRHTSGLLCSNWRLKVSGSARSVASCNKWSEAASIFFLTNDCNSSFVYNKSYLYFSLWHGRRAYMFKIKFMEKLCHWSM